MKALNLRDLLNNVKAAVQSQASGHAAALNLEACFEHAAESLGINLDVAKVVGSIDDLVHLAQAVASAIPEAAPALPVLVAVDGVVEVVKKDVSAKAAAKAAKAAKPAK